MSNRLCSKGCGGFSQIYERFLTQEEMNGLEGIGLTLAALCPICDAEKIEKEGFSTEYYGEGLNARRRESY
jgi:hypothetical protein